MADPRGLSGAVFQQTPVRDFIGDLQRQQQLTGQAISQANKAKDDFFKQYGDVKVDGVPAPYLPSYMQAVDSYRQDARKVFAETDPIKRREGEMMLDVKRNQLRIGREMAKDRYKTGAAYKGYLDEHGNKLAEDDKAVKFQTTQNFLTPQEQFNWGEDGALYFGDKTAAERTSENVLWSVPEDPKILWQDGLIEKAPNKLNGFATTSDGTSRISKRKTDNNFQVRYNNGDQYAKEGVKQVISENLNVGVDEISDEMMAAEVEANPQYLEEAKDRFYQYSANNYGDRTKTEKEGKDKRNKIRGFKSEHKPFTGTDQLGRELVGVRRGFAAPDNINVDLSVTQLGIEGEEGEFLQSEVINVIEGGDGSLYADVIYTDPQKKTRKKKTVLLDKDSENRISLELKLKEDETLQDLMPDVSGSRSTPSEQPMEQEQEKVEETDVVEGEEEIDYSNL